MDTAQTTPRPTARIRNGLMVRAAAGLPAGVALGAGDLVAQAHVAYPWANLANSPAVWGVAAFVLGHRVRSRRWSAVGAVIMLLTAVLSYYLTAAAVLGDDLGNAFSGAAGFWYAGAVGIGVLAGPAGAASRADDRWTAACGTAFAPGLLAAEASVQLGTVLAAGAGLWTFVGGLLMLKRHGPASVALFVPAIMVLAVLGHGSYLVLGLRGFGG